MLLSNKIEAIQDCESALVDIFEGLKYESGETIFKKVTTNVSFLEEDVNLPLVVIYDKYSDFNKMENTFEVSILAKAVNVDTNREIIKRFFKSFEDQGYDKLYLTDSKYPVNINSAFHSPSSTDKAETERIFTSKIEITVDSIK